MEENMTMIISDAEAIKILIDDLICFDFGAENQYRLHAVYTVIEDLICRANSISHELVNAE